MPDLKDPAYWDTSFLRATGRLLMLAAFEERPGHGYDIARRLSNVCGDWCNPSAAMIYPAIHELEAGGLIVCEVDSSTAHKRRVCRLTEDGREALRVGRAAWARFLPVMAGVVAGDADAGCCGADADPCGGP